MVSGEQVNSLQMPPRLLDERMVLLHASSGISMCLAVVQAVEIVIISVMRRYPGARRFCYVVSGITKVQQRPHIDMDPEEESPSH
jgi:hypothetical protein